MDSKQISIEIRVSVIEGKPMPEEQMIVDQIMDLLYDLQIAGSAVIDTVLITGIDGIPT